MREFKSVGLFEIVFTLLHSGKTGGDLFKTRRGKTLYQDAFTNAWKHSNKIAADNTFGTVKPSMEHSTHGDHEARVDFHVFIGPDLRADVGSGWNTIVPGLTVQEDVMT